MDYSEKEHPEIGVETLVDFPTIIIIHFFSFESCGGCKTQNIYVLNIKLKYALDIQLLRNHIKKYVLSFNDAVSAVP